MEARVQLISGTDNKPLFVVLSAEDYRRLRDESLPGADPPKPEGSPEVEREAQRTPGGAAAQRLAGAIEDILLERTHVVLHKMPEGVRETVRQIARQLNEKDPDVLFRLGMVIKHMGETLALKLADEAVAIFAGDGMRTRDGSRRRTVGGVFFQLAKNRLPEDVRRTVFPTNHRLSENAGHSRPTLLFLRIAKRATETSRLLAETPADSTEARRIVRRSVEAIGQLLREETVPSVVYILMRHGHDAEEAIVRAVNDTRDNDTVAAIVGAAVGALHGRAALSSRWIDNLLGRTTDCDDGRIFELLESAREMWWVPSGPPSLASGGTAD